MTRYEKNIVTGKHFEKNLMRRILHATMTQFTRRLFQLLETRRCLSPYRRSRELCDAFCMSMLGAVCQASRIMQSA